MSCFVLETFEGGILREQINIILNACRIVALPGFASSLRKNREEERGEQKIDIKVIQVDDECLSEFDATHIFRNTYLHVSSPSYLNVVRTIFPSRWVRW